MKDRLTGAFAVLKDIEKFGAVFIDEFGNDAWDVDTGVDSSVHWENRLIYVKMHCI